MGNDTVYLLECEDGGFIKDCIGEDCVERVQIRVSASICTSFKEAMQLYCKSKKQGFEVNVIRYNISFEVLDTIVFDDRFVSEDDLKKTMIEYFSSDYFDSVLKSLYFLDYISFGGYRVSRLGDDLYIMEKVGEE